MRCVVALGALTAVLGAIGGCGGGPSTDVSRTAVVEAPNDPAARTGIRFLGGSSDGGFALVTAPREFVFPEDHGSHDAYRNEWWYLTGNLEDDDGRRFGFELTFFRFALAPDPEPRASAWGSSQLWTAHFALTDVAGRRFVARERFARGALGLAGATGDPFRVWVADWSISGAADATRAAFDLSAADDAVSASLRLSAEKPVAAHGDRGLDRKGPETGNASYYYSFPRLRAEGSLELDGRKFDVEGAAWMDREWGSSFLGADVAGWDWFALHLSDGRDLMLYRLRTRDGAATEYSGGSLIARDGTVERLAAGDIEMQASASWTSTRSGVTYPVAWRIAIPREGLWLDVEPDLRNQELSLTVRYWEGAVHGTGRRGSDALSAEGYLELAGY